MVQLVDQPPLTDTQVAQYARQAGFTGSALATMVAVALAESGGDPDIRGDVSLQTSVWGPSIGVSQVRCLWADVGTGRPRDCNRLSDPAFNLRSAWSISSQGRDFTPWTMFTNQRYKDFLNRAWAAIAGAGKAPPVDQLPTGIEGLNRFAGEGLVEDIVNPIGSALARLALVGVLVAGGVALVTAGGWKTVAAPIRRRATETAAPMAGAPA